MDKRNGANFSLHATHGSQEVKPMKKSLVATLFYTTRLLFFSEKESIKFW